MMESRKKLLLALQEMAAKPQHHRIDGKAHVVGLCSEEEAKRNPSPLEILKNTEAKFYISEFKRSDAGKNLSDPEAVKPPYVLFLTTCYLRDVIVDQDLLL